MKKTILAVLCLTFFMGMGELKAQELTQNRKVTAYSAGALSNPVRKTSLATPAKQSRTVTFRFDEGVTTLSDAQKERLLLIANRIKDGYTKKILVVSASKNSNDATNRAWAIEAFLRSYERNIDYTVRFIKPINVVPSIDNTVKITER